MNIKFKRCGRKKAKWIEVEFFFCLNASPPPMNKQTDLQTAAVDRKCQLACNYAIRITFANKSTVIAPMCPGFSALSFGLRKKVIKVVRYVRTFSTKLWHFWMHRLETLKAVCYFCLWIPFSLHPPPHRGCKVHPPIGNPWIFTVSV